jgi:hypothetical protein
LRAYIRAARRRLASNSLVTKLLGEPIDFFDWAEGYINQLDPLHESPRHLCMANSNSASAGA